jgi:hypothetical protein
MGKFQVQGRREFTMRKPTLPFAAVAAAGFLSLAASGTANALSFGESINVNYSCTTALGNGDPQCGGGPDGGLSAEATFTFTSGDLTGDPVNDFYLTIMFRNTSTYQSNLTAIGFDYPTTIASINQFVGDDTYGFDAYQVGNLNFPGGVTLDACAETQAGGQCGGGSSAGGLIAPPTSPWATVYFGFVLRGDFTAQDFLNAFQPFDSCVRFQSVGPDGQDSGLACNGDDDDDQDVPEPGTLALLGLGLMGLGLRRRRR